MNTLCGHGDWTKIIKKEGWFHSMGNYFLPLEVMIEPYGVVMYLHVNVYVSIYFSIN